MCTGSSAVLLACAKKVSSQETIFIVNPIQAD
jgi:hypothetical protein